MSFGLLAGAAGAFPAIQRGIDDAKARDAVDEDRQYQREQRENARVDRTFGLQQRQRAVGEQQRQDQLRTDLAAVPETREIDVRPQATREIAVDNEGTPSATQVPAMQKVAAPDWMKFRGRAEAFRRGQDFEKADAYDQLASRAQFADSARRFQTLSAGAGKMSLEQLGKAASEIYNSDPLPAQIEGMKPVDGGLQFTFSNKDTGQSQTLVVKSREELMSKLEAYYSPETYSAAVQAQRAAALKRQGDLEKPEKLAPGEIQVSGGKKIAENSNPTAAQVRAASGTGAGAGAKTGKVDSPFKSIDDVFKAVEGFSNIKTELSGQQAIEAVRLARMFSTQQPGVDASAAAAAALRAAQDPTQIKPVFDPKTGQIMASVPFEGGNFFVRKIGTPGKPGDVKPEEMKGIAAQFIGNLPDDKKAVLLPAAFSKEGRARLSETVASDLRSPEGVAQLQSFLGRTPTEADIAAAIKSVESTTQQTLDLIALHGDQKLRVQFGDKTPAAPKPGGYGLTGSGAGGLTATETMDDNTLARIAAIQGHANQKGAITEIARRRAAKTNQPEFPSDAASMLNLGA